jgi:hypothetical protein
MKVTVLMTALLISFGALTNHGRHVIPAVIVDERLSVLRRSPGFDGAYISRLSHGKIIIPLDETRVDDIVFAKIRTTTGQLGWIQRDSFVKSGVKGEDERLLRLISVGTQFDRIARVRIFYELFRNSRNMPAVLLAGGDLAEAAAQKLTSDAKKKFADEPQAGLPPLWTLYSNFAGLSRFRKLGVQIFLNRSDLSFHYDGHWWKEILRRFPDSPEAREAAKRLGDR